MNRRLLVLGACLVALIAAGQALHDGRELEIGSERRLMVFVAVQSIAVALYFVAVRVLLRERASVWLVLAVAAVMRAIPLASPMFLSSDLFRYIWDGRVQLHGINPYAYMPGDAALSPLRDAAVFAHINRAMTARTIYPPAAELAFAAIDWIGQAPWVMRAAMVAFEAAAMAAMAAVLRRAGLPVARLAIYAWNPLAVWEFAGNGHVDALAIGFLALAFCAFAWRRPAATGVALACAALVKFLPALVAPALWRRGDWRLPLAGGIVVVLLYAVYIRAGWHVLGFLPGYAVEERFDRAGGYWALLGIPGLPHWTGPVFALLLAACLAGAGLRMVARPSVDVVVAARRAALLIVMLLVGASPHYPWYYPWVSLPAVLAPQRSAIFIGAAPLLLYVDPLKVPFVWQSLIYVPTIALALWDFRRPLLQPA